MNREFAVVTYVTVALFLFMMAYFVYFQVARSKEVIASPYNIRQDVFADRVVRGSILSADGEVLARTVTNDDGTSYREYPYGRVFAHVVGYNSNGRAGIEAAENFDLVTSNAFFPEKVMKDLQGIRNTGDNVVTTLDTAVQEAAYEALGGNRGAVVAIEPKTGRIVAMVSKPDYDPNSIEEDWEWLNTESGDSALFNRALYGAYPPGSTFKIVTSLAYIRQFADYANYYYVCEGSITNNGTTIECFDHTVHGEVDLWDSFAYSCNSSFSNIGLKLDVEQFKETGDDLLFNKKLPGPLASAKSQLLPDGTSSDAEMMMTAMGQGRTLISPYHLALITSAIANDGLLVRPRIVDRIENYTGTTVRKVRTYPYRELMTEEEAATLTSLMQGVVSYGTATELSGLSYSVAGKTGTAEYSSDKSKSHSWFTGFSNVEDPDLVVCVVVEGYDGNPGARSIPIAKAVFEAYHNR